MGTLKKYFPEQVTSWFWSLQNSVTMKKNCKESAFKHRPHKTDMICFCSIYKMVFVISPELLWSANSLYIQVSHVVKKPSHKTLNTPLPPTYFTI